MKVAVLQRRGTLPGSLSSLGAHHFGLDADPVDEDQLARTRAALMALPTLATALHVQTIAVCPTLEAVAERPQSASDRIADRQRAALGKQRRQLSHRDLRTGANPRKNPIQAAVQIRSANLAQPVVAG